MPQFPMPDRATATQWALDGLISKEDAAALGVITFQDAPICPPPNLAARTRKKDLLPTLFMPPATWVVGVEVKSPNEGKASPRAYMAYVARVREAVCKALAPHWAAFGPMGDEVRAGRRVAIRLVRLGGKPLDPHDNLPMAFKHVLDACCIMMGIDDGPASPIDVDHDQEQNDRIGVRITIIKVTNGPNTKGAAAEVAEGDVRGG